MVPTHRQVARPTGFVALGLAAGMAACALVGGVYNTFGHSLGPKDDGSVGEMLLSAAITTGIGGLLLWWGAPAKGVKMRRVEATLTTTLVWALTGFCGALPFMIDTRMSLPDAYFEAISGFTTTGATVVSEIEASLSRPVLLWRSLMQWLGGMGIVVLFIAIFPSLGVSGKHMFRTEVPGHSSEGLRPKITETSLVLWRLYAFFTAVQIAVMMALFSWWVDKTRGVHWSENLFDAVCHSFTTMSTGGFSTKDNSIGHFDSGLVDVVVSVFMLIAGVNFSLYYGALATRRHTLTNRGFLREGLSWLSDTSQVFRRSVEFRAYAVVIVLFWALLTVATFEVHGNLWRSARHSLFMVSTTITSTGFGTHDYAQYPSSGMSLVLVLMFVGGMSGSTAGGIKVSRVVLLAENTWNQLRKSIRPNVVQVTRLGREIVSEDTLNAVSTFFFIFIACLGAGTLVITYTDGVPVPTAFGAMLTCLSNMGPGPFYDYFPEAKDNFAGYTGTAKFIFSFAMVLGRLEFFTVLALLLPELWRR